MKNNRQKHQNKEKRIASQQANDSPILFKLLPQLKALDLNLAFPLMVEDALVRRTMDRRTSSARRIGKVTDTVATGAKGAGRATCAWPQVGKIFDDIARGSTAVSRQSRKVMRNGKKASWQQ